MFRSTASSFLALSLLALGLSIPARAELTLLLPALDREALLAEDAALSGPGVPVRYAIPVKVFVTPENHGEWSTLSGDLKLWRLRVSAPEAVNLSFGFTRYRMPPGGQLSIYTPDKKHTIRPFTSLDNETHGELWTPILPGDQAILDLVLPATLGYDLELELTTVGHGYLEFGRLPESGSCNVDVICPEGDSWRDEIRSVAVIGAGASTFCTGFIVNNTAQDLTPYFMTANHCGINSGSAPSLVVYWNYENSVCRVPGSPDSGSPGDGSLDQFQTGSIFKAASSTSDFTIVELDDDPNPEWNVHWAGWNAVSGDFPGAVAIHHPATDEKRISFEDDPTTTSSYLGDSAPGDGTHVRVDDWDLGTTEGGSSGSPLFDLDHRIVGQLHGGYAACGNDDPDWYGRISVSWEGGGSPSTRLKDWLDPVGGGSNQVLDGRDLSAIRLTPARVEVCPPADAIYQVEVSEIGGSPDPVTLSANGEPAGTTSIFGANPVTPGNSTSLTIQGTGAAAPGTYVLEVTGISTGGSEADTGELVLSPGSVPSPTLLSPADGATNQSQRPAFSWQDDAAATTWAIEIATDAAFVNMVDSATGLTAPSYIPTIGLTGDTVHYWRVRGVNACGAGADSLVRTFTTVPAPGQCSGGLPPIVAFSEDMETGAADWTHSGTGDTWTLSQARAHLGSWSFHAENVSTISDQRLVSPQWTLPESALLRFWHHQTIEASGSGCYDGAVVEISTDGQAWSRLDTEIQVIPYDGPISTGFQNPLGGENAWCGDPRDWSETMVDLAAWAGQTVELRFRLATDSSVSREGWYVDDVVLQHCGSGIFADGFESGDTSAW